MNFILGANVYIIYNSTINEELSKFIRYYSKKGKLVEHKWDVPELNIHNGGQVALINDCIYRYMNTFNHLLLNDLDEFVMPRIKDKIPEMLEDIPCAESGIYTFQNVFFRSDRKPNTSLRLDQQIITTQLSRDTLPIPCPFRSKLILKPSLIVHGSVHTAEGLNGSSPCCVSSKIGLLHHYRNNKDIPPRIDTAIDLRMQRFSARLLSSVRGTLAEVKDGSRDGMIIKFFKFSRNTKSTKWIGKKIISKDFEATESLLSVTKSG
ncbi:hypothetical protein CAPTEDRAFT_194554 [Capitella teleta]|uniref:Glycosyltransferase family 92 protein n=1 Tax=Capitella teleta TaxID=283909 RepID=R7UCZ8_CAPTE|nr:hypothetical protein CAPTEDRAFT_194554 [Capitella teleta]|eukprot:ELU04265.1 hypothetical protein CAPTEDRAFT_194554 [Capitella teleta]